MQSKLDLSNLSPIERTKILLLNYRKLKRAVLFDLDQIRESYGLFGRLEDIVNRYADGDSIWISPTVEARIRKLNETKILIGNLFNAVEACKHYHIMMSDRASVLALNRGALYHAILQYSYFDDVCMDAESIIGQIKDQLGLKLSLATFYNYKKEAIQYVSDVLWCVDEFDFKAA